MRVPLITICLSIAISAGAQSLSVRLASDVWPPFTNVAGKQAIAEALVHEALQRAKIGADTEILGFKEVIADIKQGDFDGSAALWRSPEREAFLLYSEPYLENRLILVGRKGSDVSATDFSGLTGKRIAVVSTYAYGEAVDQAEEVEFIPGYDEQENLDRLLKEEVDYMLVDDLLAQYFLRYNAEEAAQYLEIGTTPLIKRSLHFAVRKDHPRAEFIIERFNRQIRKMVADGAYNQILQLNWIRSDADGDGRLELVLGGARAGIQAPGSSYDVPMPDADAPPIGPVNRYWIDGQLYQSWEEVPEKYKVTENLPGEPYKEGAPVQGFRF